MEGLDEKELKEMGNKAFATNNYTEAIYWLDTHFVN